MSSADRVSELIDTWLISLELHLEYVELSDLAYACVQPWPRHDRPTRWVVQIAREKVLQLKQQCEARRTAGDEQFAHALETMLTLATLVGLQHIQRFIPLADPARAQPLPAPPPASPTDLAALLRTEDLTSADPALIETTRELPQLKMPAVKARSASVARQARTPTATKGQTAPVAGPRAAARTSANPASATAPTSASAPTAPTAPTATNRTPAAVKNIVIVTTKAPTTATTPAPPVNPASTTTQPDTATGQLTAAERIVIADAIRLLKWGKPWHELAELVSRIADRPGITQVRRILRAHRTDIETRANTSGSTLHQVSD